MAGSVSSRSSLTAALGSHANPSNVSYLARLRTHSAGHFQSLVRFSVVGPGSVIFEGISGAGR